MTGRLAFRGLKTAVGVRIYLGSSPPQIQRCLANAFEAIKRKRLRMTPVLGETNRYEAIACEHRIQVSATPDGSTVVILDLEVLDEDPL